jgi:N6-L-threonylcarbamoyladenine synthase
MEGHIYAALAAKQEDRGETTSLIEDRRVAANLPSTFYLLPSATPQLSLLISGGHTELVLSEKDGSYAVIGQTRDDAVGECFDKCARMLGLAYPGGPKIGKLAGEAREMQLPYNVTLPRPMLHSNDLDFSFSGLKTAVKIALEKVNLDEHEKVVDETTQRIFAREIEDAITDVLVAKTRTALVQTGAQTLIVSGGVSASTCIRARLTELMAREFPTNSLFFSSRELATDNALMIALASIAKIESKEFTNPDVLIAQGNLRLG